MRPIEKLKYMHRKKQKAASGGSTKKAKGKKDGGEGNTGGNIP